MSYFSDLDLESTEEPPVDAILCAACHKPILGSDYDRRHWHHEPWCTNQWTDDDPDGQSDEETFEDCDCDLEYHARCCPVCKEPTP